MLGDYWLFLAILLIVASLVVGQLPLLLISLLFFLIGALARLWSHFALSRVEYRRKLSATRVFYGEELQLEVQVINRKPLPLSWVQIEDEVPEEVTFLKGKPLPFHGSPRVILENLFSLSWYHSVTRRYPLKCLHRGYFAFGPARVRSGDLFGFFRREQTIPQLDYLIVYPKVVSLAELGIPSREPFGDLRARRHIFEDPVRTASVRDYVFGDSLKRIHWKTSARVRRLQTKVFEPTTTIDLALFLDVRTTEPLSSGWVPQLFELAIVGAASISNYALSEGYRVGLYANQRRRYSSESVRIPPSQHPEQLLHILESLAQLYPLEMESIASLVQRESRNIPWGSTLVVITAMPTDDLVSTLLKLKRAGRMVALLLIGETQPVPSQDGFPVYRVRDDVLWSEIEELSVLS